MGGGERKCRVGRGGQKSGERDKKGRMMAERKRHEEVMTGREKVADDFGKRQVKVKK